MKKKTILMIGIAAIIAIGSPLWVPYAFLFVAHEFNKDFLSIDKCLDAGGRWNYEKRNCEVTEVDGKALYLPSGWKYPTDTLFKNEWINENHEGYLTTAADFDRNGYLDSAFILETIDGKDIGVFVFFLDSNGYKVSEVFSSKEENTTEAEKLHPEYDPIKIYKSVYGIRVAPIGTHATACGKGYWDCEEDEEEELILDNPGIDFFHYDAGGTRYFYWDKEKLKWKHSWMDD
jgi:hypothetical protein